jgi:hypothetical protein
LTLLDRGTDTRDWFESERNSVLDDIASESGSQGTGTNITVNRGCIVIDDSPRCAGGDPYNVSDKGTDKLTATIYAKFTGSATERTEVPGCKLDASWSSSIQNINYGADDCLYDGNTQLMCCTERGVETKTNPYFQEGAQEGGSGGDTSKPKFIHPSRTDGTIDCIDKTDGGGTLTGRVYW